VQKPPLGDAAGVMSRSRGRSFRRAAVLGVLVAGGLLACGSRTGLFVDETFDTNPGADGGLDGSRRRDGSLPDVDDIPDALPPIDAKPPVDANRTDCPDSDATLIYVVTEQTELFSFYPPDGSFKKIGNIVCPAPQGTTPFSMAVDRKGVAYVVYNDGRLYRVSTATAACVGTTFTTGQQNFQTFGMGYATLGGGPAERLYIAGDAQNGSAGGLGWIDTTTFKLTKVGDFIPNVNRAELTGSGDGRLFAFYTKTGLPGSAIGQIDPTTAQVTNEQRFAGLEQGNGWAFAFWGGDFYMFTAPQTRTSIVSRFRLDDKSLVQVANLGSLIVGAGVSTCAPSQ
jgi:hypothetical protein